MEDAMWGGAGKSGGLAYERRMLTKSDRPVQWWYSGGSACGSRMVSLDAGTRASTMHALCDKHQIVRDHWWSIVSCRPFWGHFL